MNKYLSVLLLTAFSYALNAAPIPVKPSHSPYLDVGAEKITFFRNTIDVTYSLANKSGEDLDLSKAFWKASYGKQEGGINESELDGIMLGGKQKRRGTVTFAFDEKIDRNNLLELRITNIKTLRGKAVPDVVLAYQAQSAKKNSLGTDPRRQEDTMVQWTQVR